MAAKSQAGRPERIRTGRLARHELPATFGRSVESTIQLCPTEPDTRVSRRALHLHWEAGRPVCEVVQNSGAYVQRWGSAHTSLAEPGTWIPIGSVPLSFRIDTPHGFHWVLLGCEEGELESITAPPQSVAGDVTDPPPGPRFPVGSEPHLLLQDVEDDLTRAYRMFLEWPPQLDPSTTPSELVPTRKQAILKLRAMSVNYGFRTNEHQAFNAEFLTWLVDSGNFPFEYYRMHTTMGVDVDA
ncbi:hypothetical protein [Nocardia lasii]|uniref:FHA domain-containing protein n=1 Tax=Nocardia lasii TaxID=1616107 RepID=A0ABW1JS65_9NOCA